MCIRPVFGKQFSGMKNYIFKSSPLASPLFKNFCLSQASPQLSDHRIYQKRNYTSLVWLGISAGVTAVFSFYYYRAEPDGVNIILENSVYTLVRAGNLDRAIEVAMKLGDAYRKSNALKSICEELIKKGDLGRAKQLVHLFPHFDHPCLQAYYENMILMKISRKFLEMGKEDRALETLEEAREATNSMFALNSIFFIKNLLEADCFDQAKQITSSILQSGKGKKYVKVKIEALEAIATVFFDARETNEAKRIMYMIHESREISKKLRADEWTAV